MYRNKLMAIIARVALVLMMALVIGGVAAEKRDLQPGVSDISTPCQNNTLVCLAISFARK
jgi:hypothetical protein